MSRHVKRPYRSSLREETAELTRARIRESAARLFVEHGFVATTVKQVAAAAGVAERTVYAAFPSKADLFSEVLGVATVGDDLPVPVAERAEFRAAFGERDHHRALQLIVDYGTTLLERAGPLIITSIESAGADPDMRRIADEGAHATAVNLGAFVHALADHGGLRPGLEVQQAADILTVLSSPHVHHLLRHDRDWTVERYRDWLLDTLSRALLPDTPEPPRSPSSPSAPSAASEGGGRAVVDGA
jgi:AcrR family transcriptional regulator